MIKNSEEKWQVSVDNRGVLYTLGGNIKWYGIGKQNGNFFKKLKIQLPYYPVIPFCIYNQRTRISILQIQLHFHIYSIIFHNSQEQKRKEIKRENLSLVTTWMNIEHIMLSEVYQAHKDTYCMISCTCRNWKESHSERQRGDGCQLALGGRRNWEIGAY
jgi:hypothetical protein